MAHGIKIGLASVLAAAFVLWGRVGWAASASPPPPSLPMAISGTVDLPDGNPLPLSATVTALLDGQVAGSLTFQSATGTFGGSGLVPQLLVQGTAASSGSVSFEVTVDGQTIPAVVANTPSHPYEVLAANGTSGTGSGPISWAPGTVIDGVTLTLQTAPAASAVAITSAPGLPGAEAGQSYQVALQASGGIAPYRWSATGGALPPGITLQTNGTLAGTPTQSGPFFFTAEVTDAAGNTASQVEALDVSPANVPAPSQVTAASTGNAGVPAALSLVVPGGLSLTGSASGGTGTVAAAVDTQNPTTVALQAGKAYVDISVATASNFTSLNLQFCNLNGATAVYWFNGSSWTPASDQSYDAASACVTVTINASTAPSLAELTGTPFASVNAPVITTSTVPSGTVDQPYTATLNASGGTPPYTWSTAAGSQLPAGLTLEPQGTISGTPTQAGTSAVTVQVTDANHLSQLATFSLVINGAPPVTSAGGGGAAPPPVASGGGGVSVPPSSSSTTPPSPPSPATGPITQSIGPSGGTITTTTGQGTQITVTLPAGAVSQSTQITVNPLTTLPAALATGAPTVIQAVDLTSAPATIFAQPVTVTLTFASPPGPVTVAFWNPSLNAWQPIADLTLTDTTVSFTTRHFTVFAAVPPGSVPMVNRLAGLTRIETAVQAAKAAFPDGAAAVVLANAGTGAPSPDALAAAGLAGAVSGPILLTEPDHLPAVVLQTIQALGATTVYVVGGPAAVSDAMIAALKQQGLTVVRDFEGLDRFQTAALIDAYLYQHHLTQARSAFVANGVTMVDALSASPVLFQKAAPLILVNSGQTTLPAAAWQAMQAAGIQRVVILGGPAAVTPALQQAIAQPPPVAADSPAPANRRDPTGCRAPSGGQPGAVGGPTVRSERRVGGCGWGRQAGAGPTASAGGKPRRAAGV